MKVDRSHIHRTSALLAALMLMSTLLGGCQNGDNTSSKPASSASSAEATASGNEQDEKYTITWLSGASPTTEDSIGEQYLEETFNVDIQPVIVEATDYDQKVGVLLASGNIPDYIRVGNINTLSDYTKQGILKEIPVSDIQQYMPKYYDLSIKADPNIFTYSIFDGKNMGVAIVNAGGMYPITVAIRADWLTNVGITKVPTTLAELEDAFYKFRNNDPDQNGEKDTYAMSMGADCVNGRKFQSIFGAYGVNPFNWRVSDDGTLEYGFVTEDFKNALKLLQKWYNDGLIDPEFVTDNYRTSGDDICSKFARGTTGYLDSYSFDDHHWDNDGNLSAKWIANNEGWKEYYESDIDNPDLLYSIDNFYSMDDVTPDLPGPVYIDMSPVTGLDGKSGYIREGIVATFAAVGKQVENDPGKYHRILTMLEALATDEDIYVNAQYGPEGMAWETDATGDKVFKADWPQNELYHPQWLKTGNGTWANTMFQSNPDFMAVIGGARTKQRYRLGDVAMAYPYVENVVKISLPSLENDTSLTDSMVNEFMIQAIAQNIDIDTEFPNIVEQWNKQGGSALTQEANDWYSSIQE